MRYLKEDLRLKTLGLMFPIGEKDFYITNTKHLTFNVILDSEEYATQRTHQTNACFVSQGHYSVHQVRWAGILWTSRPLSVPLAEAFV